MSDDKWPQLPGAPTEPGDYWWLQGNCTESELVRVYRPSDRDGFNASSWKDPKHAEILWVCFDGGAVGGDMVASELSGIWWGPVHPPTMSDVKKVVT